MTRTRNWENKHKMVWINKELCEKIDALKIRDESTNSVIQDLYKFYIENGGGEYYLNITKEES